MIVVDTSAVIEILTRTPIGQELELALGSMQLHAPHVIDLEVLSVARRWETRGMITRADALRIVENFKLLKIKRHPHIHLLDPIWALRHNLTSYDAAYLALARSLDAKLVTMDAGLRKAAGDA